MLHRGYRMAGDPNGELRFYRPDGSYLGASYPVAARVGQAAIRRPTLPLTIVIASTIINISTIVNVRGGRDVPCATGPQCGRHRPGGRVLLEAVRDRTGQAPGRLRQL